MSIFLQPEALLAQFRGEYQCGLEHVKTAGEATKAYSLSGELQLSSSGWALLKVPNAIVRGLFDAMSEPGLELPLKDGRLNSHISVMSPDEIKSIGGPDKISEFGHHYSYTLGPMKTVKPAGWPDVSVCHFCEVDSPELRQLRKSYGLTPLRNDYAHHITVAVRRVNVLHNNNVSKGEVKESSDERAQRPRDIRHLRTRAISYLVATRWILRRR